MDDEPFGPGGALPEPDLGPGPEGRSAGRSDDEGRRDRDRIHDLLDLYEGRHAVPILDDEGIAGLLRSVRRIAVVGASDDPSRPSFEVFRFLRGQGLDCVPVNPNVRSVLGVPAFPSLAEAAADKGPIEIVDVFRRSELCLQHAREAVAIGARCLWLQLGVVNWEAARIAQDGGLSVVMDRCTAIEWRRVAPEHPDVAR